MWFECFDFISFCSSFELWEQEKALRVHSWDYDVFNPLSLLLEIEAAGPEKGTRTSGPLRNSPRRMNYEM